MSRVLRPALLVALLPALAAAGGIDFTASVDQTTVGLGGQFTLTLAVTGDDLTAAPRPELPELQDIDLLGQSSSRSTHISVINGQMRKQATFSFTYVLSAKKLGPHTIPPCKLTYGGGEHRTQPIGITVVKSAPGRGAAPGQPVPGRAATDPAVPVDGNLFLTASADRRTVRVGEQVTLHYTLFNRLRIGNIGMAEQPAYGGFWSEKIYDADKASFSRRTVDGKEYDALLVKKVALFPMSTGELTVKPMALNVSVVRPPRDFFDMFGTAQEVRIESKPLAVTVLPLPEPKPEDFRGGVGNFTISSSLDRTLSENGEPFTLTVRISGTGNVRLVEKPVLPPIPGLRVLDPEVREDIRAAGDAIKGTKSFRYPMIPQADGRYLVPSVTMSFYEPGSKSYRTVSTAPIGCTAAGCGQAQPSPLADVSGLKVLGTDITTIKPDRTALPVERSVPCGILAALYVSALGLIGGSFLLRFHRTRLASDRGFARLARSAGLAKKRLRAAESLLAKRRYADFHAALTQAVLGYTGDRYDLDTRAMTKDQLRDALIGRNLPGDAVTEIVAILDQCEYARFAPGLLTDTDPRALLKRVKAVLHRV